MKINRNDDYEEMAAAFQCFQIQTLYNTLMGNGVEPKIIETICAEFSHSFGTGIDQCWVESEDGRVFPTIAFTKKHMDYEPDEIYLNNGAFSFAEYTFGNIDWFFEENEPTKSPQKYGHVGENGEPADDQ